MLEFCEVELYDKLEEKREKIKEISPAQGMRGEFREVEIKVGRMNEVGRKERQESKGQLPLNMT